MLAPIITETCGPTGKGAVFEARRQGDGAQSRARDTAPARLVIIDDDDDIRDGLSALLLAAGYEVTAFECADDALAALDHDRAPHAIVLDLMMPGMNGWQFRVEQAKREALRDVPTIVLTADVSAYAQSISSYAYVAKPIDFDRLEAVIKRATATSACPREERPAAKPEHTSSLAMLGIITHEIKNLLGCLLANLDIAASELALGEPSPAAGVPELVERLQDATDAAERIASLVKLVASISREPCATKTLVDVLRVCEAAARMARPLIERQARLHLELTPVPTAQGDATLLMQVILNLLINAAQAINETGIGGDITLLTSSDGGSVVVEVRDTGPGIAPEHLERIFQPHFTTKPTGEGSGLGLSISNDIAKVMGGTLTATSRPGNGATFRVSLPVPGQQTGEVLSEIS